MAKVYLTIAQSLDGYIADSDGSYQFLFEKKRTERDADYEEFYNSLSMILFGKNTYRQMLDEMERGGVWPYPEKRCVVFDHSEPPPSAPPGACGVEFSSLSAKDFMDKTGSREQKNIWLFGGRKLIASFMEYDLVDHYWVYVMPVILGGGVPLFSPDKVKRNLKLTKCDVIDGFRVKLFYERER
jgi:dihydrofolate reductase